MVGSHTCGEQELDCVGSSLSYCAVEHVVERGGPCGHLDAATPCSRRRAQLLPPRADPGSRRRGCTPRGRPAGCSAEWRGQVHCACPGRAARKGFEVAVPYDVVSSCLDCGNLTTSQWREARARSRPAAATAAIRLPGLSAPSIRLDHGCARFAGRSGSSRSGRRCRDPARPIPRGRRRSRPNRCRCRACAAQPG